MAFKSKRLIKKSFFDKSSDKVSELYSILKNVNDLSYAEVKTICGLKSQHWPYSEPEQLDWWAKNSSGTDLSMQILCDGRLIAFLRLRDQQVFVRDDETRARCITEVCVSKEFSGSGIGSLLMKEATLAIDTYFDRLGFLLCGSAQKGFYEKCGWNRINGGMVKIDKNSIAVSLSNERYCFVHDPLVKVSGTFVLVGKNF